MLARLDAEGDEGTRGASTLVMIVAPRQRLPRAVTPRAKRRGIGRLIAVRSNASKIRQGMSENGGRFGAGRYRLPRSTATSNTM